jgi:hypothetical protein
VLITPQAKVSDGSSFVAKRFLPPPEDEPRLPSDERNSMLQELQRLSLGAFFWKLFLQHCSKHDVTVCKGERRLHQQCLRN